MVSPNTMGRRNFHSRIAKKRDGVDSRHLTDQAGGDRHAEQSMGDGPAERPALARRVVDMQRIEVPGKTGEQNDIRFRDSPAWAFPLIPDHKIVE